jgi:DNA-binding CsgD family transcriptional regulator
VFRRSSLRGTYHLPPTDRQLESLRAYVRHGSHAAAARAMGVSERTLKNHLAALRERLNVRTTAQSVYVLWMGYRDHVHTCRKKSHDACLPFVEDLAS